MKLWVDDMRPAPEGADKALNKIQEKYPDRHIYMIDYKYLGHTVEIIRQEVR